MREPLLGSDHRRSAMAGAPTLQADLAALTDPRLVGQGSLCACCWSALLADQERAAQAKVLLAVADACAAVALQLRHPSPDASPDAAGTSNGTLGSGSAPVPPRQAPDCRAASAAFGDAQLQADLDADEAFFSRCDAILPAVQGLQASCAPA